MTKRCGPFWSVCGNENRLVENKSVPFFEKFLRRRILLCSGFVYDRNPIPQEDHMLPEKQQTKFSEFYDAVRNNDILDPKTTLLLHLAAAMALGCTPCMETYLSAAGKAGITAKEIGTVQGAVMAVAAGRVNAQVREVELRMQKSGACCG
jgi:alkylhydroperoxidase/carboxymuconolactone decarboxylase family protein YurZ